MNEEETTTPTEDSKEKDSKTQTEDLKNEKMNLQHQQRIQKMKKRSLRNKQKA